MDLALGRRCGSRYSNRPLVLSVTPYIPWPAKATRPAVWSHGDDCTPTVQRSAVPFPTNTPRAPHRTCQLEDDDASIMDPDGGLSTLKSMSELNLAGGVVWGLVIHAASDEVHQDC